MAETFDWSKLRVEVDGTTMVAPCLAFTIWFEVTDRPTLLAFYDRVMEALGTHFTHYTAEDMKRPAKITARARTLVPTWLRRPAEFHFYFARFQASAAVGGASFEVYYRDRPRPTPEQEERFRRNLPIRMEQGGFQSGYATSTFRVTVPLDHPLADPTRFRDWVLDFEAVKSGEFVTGGCDLALNHFYGWGDAERRYVHPLCMRYPGLDWLHPSIHMYLHRYEPSVPEMLPLVKRAGWITLVNERSAAVLGGPEKLAETLRADPTVTIHRLAHGLAIQAGDAPRVGDLSRLDVPYRSVAAAIRPVRIERVGDPRWPDEWMTEWLSALDRPYPEAQP